MEIDRLVERSSELVDQARQLDERVIGHFGKTERLIATSALLATQLGIGLAGYERLQDENNYPSSTQLECAKLCISASIEYNPQPVVRPTDIQKVHKPLPKVHPKLAIKRVAPKPEAVQIPKLPLRYMSYERFSRRADEYLDNLPSLTDISRIFPASISEQSAQKQLAYIAELNREVQVTPLDFAKFKINRDFNTAFRGVGSYEEEINPKFFLIHWTSEYYDGPEHLAESMSRNLKRIDYFIDRQAQTYQLFESDRNKPAHILNLNSVSQGVEIEAAGTLDYTPEQIEQAIMLAVDFCRRNHLKVNDKTILGHYAADLIFNNPYYSPSTGKFKYKSIHKFDPPQELMRVIVAKAKALNKGLELSS